ncbi:MAG: hypothetical protein II968_05055 [Selenomonadaceae bacterium]|nr:hypothetical protein [Selenomonadaceae bacterium]
MFYQTQVKSIIQGGVIDVHGKQLSLIGNKLVKKGDFVWTDGNVVFGHTPIRGGGVLHAEQSGIPVLANNLRGYFNLNGDFKSYNIVGDAWIVNDKKFYAHDVDDAEIIDADFADDSEFFTVEKSLKTFSQDTDDDYIFESKVYGKTIHSFNSDYLIKNGSTIALFRFDISFANADYVRCDEQILKDCDIIIKKGNVIHSTLTLSQLLSNAEQNFKQNVTFIKVDSETPEDHIKSRAILRNFKILPDGNWLALIEYEIWIERGFLYETQLTYRATIKKTVTTQSTPVGGGWTADETWTTIEVVDPPNGVPVERYSSSTAHTSCLIKFSSDAEPELIFEDTNFYPLYLVKTQIEAVESASPSAQYGSLLDYPCVNREEDYVMTWINVDYMDESGYVPGIPAAMFSPRSDHTYESYHYYRAWWSGSESRSEYETFEWGKISTSYIYDSRNLPDAPDYDNPILDIAKELTLPVQDCFFAKLINRGSDINFWAIEGIYDRDNKKVFNFDVASNTHTWNMCFFPLKGNKFLFGVHNGYWYKINDEGLIESIGRNLKNFRFRELKRISKARK